MSDKDMIWEEYQKKQKELMIYGLRNGYIDFYNDELITKLRDVYYGGVPASLILLSNKLSNGYCYDRATLLSRAFLDSDDDINLIYATVDGIKLNPKLYRKTSTYADHCFLERITPNNESYIYDTSMGFVFTKNIYWMIENPKVRKINTKDKIRKFVEDDSNYHINEFDSFIVKIILPFIEKTLNLDTEVYACSDYPILQREIEYFKEKIRNEEENNYKKIVKKRGF